MGNAQLAFVVSLTMAVAGALQERTQRLVHVGEKKAEYEASCVRNLPVAREARIDAAGRAALQSMASCPDTGAAVVAERWAARPTDTTYVNMLQQVSRNINDERIADAALAIVEDRSAPEKFRRRALETLVTQLSPTIYIRHDGDVLRLSDVLSDTAQSRPFPIVAIGTPHFYVAGRREIGADARTRYEQRLLALATRDSTMSSSIRALLNLAEEARRRVR